jgi:hypothetical protein
MHNAQHAAVADIDEETACNSIAGCGYTAGVPAACDDNEEWPEYGAEPSPRNANPIHPLCDYSSETWSGEWQAPDECAWGCNEVVTGCPQGYETWPGMNECYRIPEEPEAEPEDWSMETFAVEMPPPGCKSEDGMFISEPLYDKIGCDDDCAGGVYVEIVAGIDGTPATCTEAMQMTDDPLVDSITCEANGGVFEFGTADTAPFGLCAFCTLETYCDEECEAMGLPGCCWEEPSSNLITAADYESLAGSDGIESLEYCQANAAAFTGAYGDATAMQPLEMWDVCNPLDDQCGTDLTCQEGGDGIYECMLHDAMDASGGR